jgi:hypothetical protein
LLGNRSLEAGKWWEDFPVEDAWVRVHFCTHSDAQTVRTCRAPSPPAREKLAGHAWGVAELVRRSAGAGARGGTGGARTSTRTQL